MGFPRKQNTENITSLEAPRISGISTTLRDGKSEVISDFPAGLSCPPQPIFTSSAQKALWTQGIDKRHN